MNQWVRMLLKNRHYYLLFVLFLFVLNSCDNSEKEGKINLYKLSGEAQGTTYTIQVYDGHLNFEQAQIDSILSSFDDDLSTYLRSSLVSRFNSKSFKDTILLNNSKFVTMLELSDSIYNMSAGLFDPSVKPLMDLWDFDGYRGVVPSQKQVDSVLRNVSFQKGKHFDFLDYSETQTSIIKNVSSFQLDFNAIAQGYAVDVLMAFVKSKGHNVVYIELGGEIALSGLKFNNEKWRIGIEVPIENNRTSEREIQKVFSLTDKCIATSGNYRKYFEFNGEKYAHTINPRTGFQNKHNLLSATVFSESCAVSDAYATVFMLLGLEGTIDFIKNNPTLGLDVFLIYDESNSYMTYYSIGLQSVMN